MNEYNDIFDKAKVIFNAMGKKTEEVVESSKLKIQILSVNSDIAKAYQELGSIIYHAAKQNSTCAEEVESKMDEIDELLHKLHRLEQKISEIYRVRKCPNCGAACPSDAHFCSRCGMIINPMQEEPQQTMQRLSGYAPGASDADYVDCTEPLCEEENQD